MKTSILVATALAVLSTHAAGAPSNYGDGLTDKLAPKYVAPSGAPDPQKPIFLMKGSLVCRTEEGIFAGRSVMQKALDSGTTPSEDSMFELGCVLTPNDIRVGIVGAEAGHEANVRQSMLGHSQIYWRNQDGSFWYGWASTARLKNYH
ncbi:hypothetical protein [Robbsia andropogonis]|uniref:hypothetical protein n=1 Tax=Robbsia andropogonis TaxID=28092 RepID=UPI000466B151|nr:hypothetical protein [Robbsia andropogonis]